MFSVGRFVHAESISSARPPLGDEGEVAEGSRKLRLVEAVDRRHHRASQEVQICEIYERKNDQEEVAMQKTKQ